MADNVAITAGSGTTIASDDVGGVQYQRVKACWGPDGTANDTDVATGKPMPVQMRTATGVAVDWSGGASPTNISGTISTGGAAQNAAASNSSRIGFFLQNVSTGDLWFSTIATAVASQPSIRLSPGQMYESPFHCRPTGAISIIGATTSQAFVGREW